MVLEQLFKTSWIEKRPRHAFLLGLVYSVIGIISARLIFGANPGMMSVAFTSVLLIPSLNQLLKHEENAEMNDKKFSIKRLFKDHKDIFEIYIFLFFGIFTAFSVISLIFPQATILKLFEPQLGVAGITGRAFDVGFFTSILLNNILVLTVCLVLSLVYGAGAVLFLTWNASVWGAFFGFVAKQSAFATDSSPLIAFVITILPELPHMITEAVSYLSASIVGGVLSKAVLREDINSKKFNHVVTDALLFMAMALILIIIAAAIEAR